MDSIDSALGKRVRYEIPTIKPEFVTRTYPNDVQPISMLPWSGSIKMLGFPTYRSIMNSDLTLVFDAILFDRALYNPLFNYLSTLALLLPRAKKQGKKLGCFNVGVGPVTTPRGKRMLRDVLELMDFITVRDQDSLKIVREIGVANENIFVTADAALAVAPSPQEKLEKIIQGIPLPDLSRTLAVNISAYLDSWAGNAKGSMGKEKFLSIYCAALNRAVEQLKVPVLFVCTQHHDVAVSEEVRRRLPQGTASFLVSNKELSHFDVKGILGRVGMLFGMRLHAVILATSELTPAIALPHQPKVTHYLRSAGLEHLSFDFKNFSEDTLTRFITSAWEQRTEIRSHLTQVVPVLKERAQLASLLVKAIDQGASIPDVFSRLKSISLVEIAPAEQIELASGA